MFLSILQAIIAIPKIISMAMEIVKVVQAAKARQKESQHEDHVAKLREAKTNEEAKQALRDIANNP